MTKEEITAPLSYRMYHPHQSFDEVIGPVEASSVDEALNLLNSRNLSNLQVMENGIWKWVA